MRRLIAALCILSLTLALTACTRHSDATPTATTKANIEGGSQVSSTPESTTPSEPDNTGPSEPGNTETVTTAPSTTGSQMDVPFIPVGLWASADDSGLLYILAPGGIGYYDYGTSCTWDLVDDVLSVYDEDGTELWHVVVSENEPAAWEVVQQLRGVEVLEDFDPIGVWVNDRDEQAIFMLQESGGEYGEYHDEIFFWTIEGCILYMEFKGEDIFPYVILGDYLVSIYGDVLTRLT